MGNMECSLWACLACWSLMQCVAIDVCNLKVLTHTLCNDSYKNCEGCLGNRKSCDTC
jgi:hypothetical protein